MDTVFKGTDCGFMLLALLLFTGKASLGDELALASVPFLTGLNLGVVLANDSSALTLGVLDFTGKGNGVTITEPCFMLHTFDGDFAAKAGDFPIKAGHFSVNLAEDLVASATTELVIKAGDFNDVVIGDLAVKSGDFTVTVDLSTEIVYSVRESEDFTAVTGVFNFFADELLMGAVILNKSGVVNMR